MDEDKGMHEAVIEYLIERAKILVREKTSKDKLKESFKKELNAKFNEILQKYVE